MSDEGEFWPLIWAFFGLSLFSVGGGIAILPEMHRMVVEQHGWLDDLDFSKRFALAQAAPGPNIMVVGLIGWHVAGAAGMFGAMLAMCGPSSILAFAFARLRHRKASALWLRVTERGLVPIAVGLIAASGLLLAEGAAEAPLAIGITAGSTLFVWRTSRSPLWVLLAGAGLGATLLR